MSSTYQIICVHFMPVIMCDIGFRGDIGFVLGQMGPYGYILFINTKIV